MDFEAEIKNLKAKVKTLEEQSFRLPLSPKNMGALKEAFISFAFDKIRTRRLILTPTKSTTNPAEEGEIIYHGTTPSIKLFIGGVVKTFTIS